jgi:hypothetical protein
LADNWDTEVNKYMSQKDPALLLLLNSTGTQQAEMGIQGAVGNVVQDWSNGATNNISAGDAALSTIVAGMSGLTGSDLQKANTHYQNIQTQVSNNNNLFSNVMQGGGTILTNLTDVESQNLQFCSVASDIIGNVSNMLMGWGS